MKILLINEAFYPDTASTAQHLTDLALHLAKSGHEVTVLTSRRNYSNPAVLYPSSENYQGVRVVRSGSLFLGGGEKGKGKRVLNALLLNLAFLWQLLWMPRFDRIVALTSPPLVGFLAALFSKCRKNKFIYWVMDVNPDEAVEAGWIRRGSIQARLLEAALRFTLKSADRVVALDEFMKERLEQKIVKKLKSLKVKKLAEPLNLSTFKPLNTLSERIVVIPPWSHDEHLLKTGDSPQTGLGTVPILDNPFRKQHGLEGKFVVMYSGNHSICHPLDTLLNAALKLRDRANIVFVFVGGGERVKDVTEFKKRYQLPNILQLPYQPLSGLQYSLSAADLHAVVMGEPYVGIVHPCKIYDILRIGKPFVFIGPKRSHIGRLIEDVGARHASPVLPEGVSPKGPSPGGPSPTACRVDHGEVEKLAKVIEGCVGARHASPVPQADSGVRHEQIAEKFSAKTLLPLMEKAITAS